jgi:hypothetical protein
MGLPLTLTLGDDSTTAMVPWVTVDALGFAKAEESVDLTSVCLVASQILYILSGRRYGIRTETLRPVAGQRNCGWGDLMRMQYMSANWLWLYRSNEGAPSSLQLKSPVQTITSVKVDGVVLDPSAYQLYDNRSLVRLQDSSGTTLRWPIYQRLELPDTEVGSFAITYSWGTPVPEGGKLAAQVFATELARYLNRDESAFSDRTISVTRQGVSQALDPTPFLTGSTGLYFVDSWLKTVNPSGGRRRPSITSPDSILNARAT